MNVLKALIASLLIGVAVFAMACGDDEDPEESGDGGGTATTTATAAATATAFPAGSTMAEIVDRGKMVVGVKYDVPLFGLLDPVSREVDGFDVALAKEIAKELGLEEDQVEFIEAISANRIPFLQEDRADLIISTMTINAERKTQIEFSRPYYLAGQSILIEADNTAINGIDDLNGKQVCSVQGSTSEKNVVAKAPQAQLLSLETYSACVSAMKDGRVEAVSTDDLILAGCAATDSDLKLVGGQFTQELYGVGIKKGATDMAEFVSGVIGDMLEDGRWEDMYEEYLGDVEGLPSASVAKQALPATS